ncbi:hypothetical protein ZWY2020_013911 [Hordeum vulgare]|nr:hypothetical protein ZWY2020_013911 [Hordeum vulgare]
MEALEVCSFPTAARRDKSLVWFSSGDDVTARFYGNVSELVQTKESKLEEKVNANITPSMQMQKQLDIVQTGRDTEPNQIGCPSVNTPIVNLQQNSPSGNSVSITEQKSPAVSVLNETKSKEMSDCCPSVPFLSQNNAGLDIISYFEFLIITEFKLPSTEPRLTLWSANMLNSYMALDALHGKNNEYGRLSDKIILQMQAQKFFRNIIRNSTPTLKTYVDDMNSSFLKTWTSSSSLNLQFKSALLEKEIKVPTTKKLLAIEPPPNIPMLTVPTIIDEYKEININEILEHLVKDFPDSVNITSTNFSLPLNLPTSEELTCPQLLVKRQSPKATPPIDVSALLRLHPKNIGTPIEDHLLVQVLEQHEGQSTKFSTAQPSTWHQGSNKCFKSAKLAIQEHQMSSKSTILSNGIENDFYQLMVGVLPKLTHKIFEIEEVWVHQKTITLSFKTGGWINPRVVGCFAKLKNKDQLNRGRKGLLPNSELVEHIVSPDDMVVLTLCNSSLNIGNFESRFVAGPKVNFRSYLFCHSFFYTYDSGIFLLQYITKFKGVGLDCFSNDDIQALRQKFLFEIITCNDNEIQLPLVTSFLQSHEKLRVVVPVLETFSTC